MLSAQSAHIRMSQKKNTNRYIQEKKIIFLDMDGTIYIGNKLIAGAKRFLRYLKQIEIPYYFLSNNSSRSKNDYIQKLRKLGIDASEEEIILSTDGTIDYLLRKKIKHLYVVGTQSMKQMFIRAGLQVASQKPEMIVLGFDTEMTYEKLKKAALWMQRGIPLIATHPDFVCPTPEGFIPDAGAMLALLEKSTHRLPLKVFGKPNPEMITHILKKHNVRPSEIVIIGDRLYTDREMALRLKCDFILVLSGETKEGDIHDLDPAPALIVKSVGHIRDPQN